MDESLPLFILPALGHLVGNPDRVPFGLIGTYFAIFACSRAGRSPRSLHELLDLSTTSMAYSKHSTLFLVRVEREPIEFSMSGPEISSASHDFTLLLRLQSYFIAYI